MNARLCVGIFSAAGIVNVTTLEPGKHAVEMVFPATESGVNALQALLANYGNSLRLAVSGDGALNLGLTLGAAPGREVFIVSSSVAAQSAGLACYAEQSI